MAMALVRLVAEPTREKSDAVRLLVPSVDLDRLLDLLAAQRLVATLGGLLLDDPEVELPDQTAQRIQGARLRARQRGLFDHAITKQLTDGLARRGLDVVPLKGAVLAEAVYGDIGARQSSDIDLLVRLADLPQAVEVAEQLGWREPELLRKAGIPSLHRELFHAELPPLELHWRVHWYEDSFAEAALARAELTENGWLWPRPSDEIVCLLLFLARDGFAGLRQLVDVAAWWAARGRPHETATDVREVGERHPELAPASTAAGRYAERAAARGRAHGGSVPIRARPNRNPACRPLADRVAGAGRGADVTGGRAACAASRLAGFVRRQLLIPRWGLVRRQPNLEHASRVSVGAARLAHTVRVLARYGLASRALLPRRPS